MISVIVCHHKGALLRGALQTLQKSLEVEYEIIVATSDESAMTFWEGEFPDVRFLLIQGGPAKKRNVASKFAAGEFIAFYDDDVEVTPYSLFQMQYALKQNEKCGMVFGKLRNMEFPERFDEAGSYLTQSGFLYARAESGIQDVGQFDQTVAILAGKSAACMIRRKVFWETGGFDISYEILGEETDLAWRVWLYGYQVYYVPKSVTFHAFNTKFKPRDFYTPKRVYFNGSRNYLAMLTTNLSDRKVWFPVICQLIVWTMAGAGFLVTGKYEAGSNVFKGILWYFIHLPQVLLKRSIVQSNRKVSDKTLLPLIMKNPPVSYYIKRFFHYIKTGRHG